MNEEVKGETEAEGEKGICPIQICLWVWYEDKIKIKCKTNKKKNLTYYGH